MSAFVIAGCPARNRSWALPIWWSAMHVQTVKPEHAMILLNDCEDDSLGTLQSLAEGTLQKPELNYEVINTGVPGWHRGTRDSGWREGPHPRYHEDNCANLAFLRNRWAEMCFEKFPRSTHLWSVDSDVAPDPDCLELLLAADKEVVAGVVANSRGQMMRTPAAYNFMTTWGEDGEPKRLGWLDWFDADSDNEPFQVAMTGACLLLARTAWERGYRWAADPRGEDVGAAKVAQELGIELWVEPRARTRHFMDGPDEEPLR